MLELRHGNKLKTRTTIGSSSKGPVPTAQPPGFNVIQGTAWITAQQIVVYLASFIFYVVLARVLTKAEVGVVSLLGAAMAGFNVFTLIALPQASTRYISRHLGAGQEVLAGSVVRTTLRLAVLVSVPTAVVAAFFSPQLNRVFFPQGQDYVLALVVVFVVGVVIDLYLLYGAYMLGAGMYAEYAYQTILYVPLSRGLGLVLALIGFRVLGIVYGWLIGGVAALALSWYLWRNRLPQPSHYPLRPLLGFMLPLFLTSLISFGQQWGDIGVLQIRLGELSTTGGYYLVASSAGFLSAFWFPVANALYPTLSAAHATDDIQGITDRLAIAFRLTNLAVLPTGAIMAALAPTLVNIAFGAPYVVDSIPLALLAVGTILTAQAAIFSTTLQAVGRTRTLFRVTFVAILFDLALVWIIAPYLSAVGAAFGRVVLYGTTVYLSYRSLRGEVRTDPFKGFRRPVILTTGVAVPLFLTDEGLNFLGFRPLLRIPLLLIVLVSAFLIVSRTFRIFHGGDFAMLKEILPKRFHKILRQVQKLILSDDVSYEVKSLNT